MKTDVLPHHEGLREKHSTRQEAGRATGKALGDADYGEERDKRKEVRGKRPLDRIPEKEPVQYEHFDGERLVGGRVPRNLEDLAGALEQSRIGGVVQEGVRRRDGCAGRDEAEQDVESQERQQREFPPAPRQDSR